MRVIKKLIGAIAVLVLAGTGAAHAAGVDYTYADPGAGSGTLYDLSQVTGTTADDPNIGGTFTGVAVPSSTVPPTGFNWDDTVHLNWTWGLTTGASFTTEWVFNLLPPLGTGGQTFATIQLGSGANNLIDTLTLTMYEDDVGGVGFDGGETAVGTITVNGVNGSQSGDFGFSPLQSATNYVLVASGTLNAAVENGSAVISLSTVPVPPAILLLLTGIGALFGFSRIRKAAA